MSAASLEPFAKAVGQTVMGRFTPKRAFRKGAMAMSGRYMPNRFRSVSEGIKAGKTAFVISYGTYQRPYMTFKFSTKVWQYAYWEPMWMSLAEGTVDAEIFIEKNYKRYLPGGLEKMFNFTSPNVSY
jgi:hypothetical protein